MANTKTSTQIKPELYIGLMSGTSIDGIDGVLTAITPKPENEASGLKGAVHMETLATISIDWPEETRKLLHGLCQQGSSSDHVFELGLGSNLVAEREAEACLQLLQKAGISAAQVTAVGAHGQTIRHHPEHHFSIQIDNGPLLAARTGIDVVVNFRAADLAHQGQGAPLTQAFHRMVLSRPGCTRIVLNLGGIANLTVINPQGQLLAGFDSGPANTLLDLYCRQELNIKFDPDGVFARQGKVQKNLLTRLRQDEYFARNYPKSTGRELFNSAYLQKHLDGSDLKGHATPASPASQPMAGKPDAVQCDILATLTELTASTAADAIARVASDFPEIKNTPIELVICGGGVSNTYLLERIKACIEAHHINCSLLSSDDLNIKAKFIEAQAFAYFTWCQLHGICLELGSSTNASAPSILGCLCPAADGHYARKCRNQML